MIGTGVFTSLGFQLAAVHQAWTIALLWLSGGMLALFGAMAYAELGTHFTASGGDYIYLSRVFHPMLGYLSAWAGLTVGFSAPVALAAMAFTRYLAPLGVPDKTWVAITVILVITLSHSFTLRHSSRVQNVSTVLKVMFILALIAIGMAASPAPVNALYSGPGLAREVFSPGFAVSMIYVGFAYTGWNAAAYVVAEIRNPRRNLPLALVGSTLFVAVCYLLFQFVLLKHASAQQLTGREDVSFIAFNNLLGARGGKWVSVCIALQLVATLSSYLWVGPRVTHAMAKENTLWKPLAKENKHGIPVAALWLHAAFSIVLVMTGSFEKILLYAGFVLQLMSSLTVSTSLFIRNGQPGSFTTPLKPVLQLIFLLFSAWVLVFTAIERTFESIIGLAILAAGVVLYLFDRPEPGAALRR